LPYEQAAALTEVGAGIVLQPNGIRMLRRLGFGEELGRLGARWLDSQFLHADGAYPGQLLEMDRQLSRLVFKSPYEGHAFVNFVIPLVGTRFGSRA